MDGGTLSETTSSPYHDPIVYHAAVDALIASSCPHRITHPKWDASKKWRGKWLRYDNTAKYGTVFHPLEEDV